MTVFFPVAFPLKIIPPECAWEKLPDRANVTEGAAREMLNIFSKNSASPNSRALLLNTIQTLSSWPGHQKQHSQEMSELPCSHVLKHEQICSAATQQGQAANLPLSNILHAPHISRPTGCTLSKLEPIRPVDIHLIPRYKFAFYCSGFLVIHLFYILEFLLRALKKLMILY